MQYPIIDLITDAYINNGWTGLDLTYGKNLMPFNEISNNTWATDWMNPVIVPRFSDFISSLEDGQYTISFDFEVYDVFSSFTSETAIATTGRIAVNPGHYTNRGYDITRQQALENYSNHSVITFYKTASINNFYAYGLGRNTATEGAPNGALGRARFYNIQIEKGITETPYEPYHVPYTDIANRLKLPLVHYFPHPVIDALISAADGQHTEEEKDVLRHYLTPLGIGGI